MPNTEVSALFFTQASELLRLAARETRSNWAPGWKRGPIAATSPLVATKRERIGPRTRTTPPRDLLQRHWSIGWVFSGSPLALSFGPSFFLLSTLSPAHIRLPLATCFSLPLFFSSSSSSSFYISRSYIPCTFFSFDLFDFETASASSRFASAFLFPCVHHHYPPLVVIFSCLLLPLLPSDNSRRAANVTVVIFAVITRTPCTGCVFKRKNAHILRDESTRGFLRVCVPQMGKFYLKL